MKAKEVITNVDTTISILTVLEGSIPKQLEYEMASADVKRWTFLFKNKKKAQHTDKYAEKD